MATYKNEAGEDVEAFTQEELDAKVKEQAEAAAAKAIEDYKAANPEKTPEQIAADKAAADEKAKADAEPIAQLSKTVEALQASLRARDTADLAKTYAGGDKAKQAEFATAFGRLSGFEATPEGMAQQAEAAARMIGIDVTSVNVGDVAGTGGGRNVDSKDIVPPTETDKVVQSALGIKAEDVTKYGEAAAKVVEEKK